MEDEFDFIWRRKSLHPHFVTPDGKIINLAPNLRDAGNFTFVVPETTPGMYQVVVTSTHTGITGRGASFEVKPATVDITQPSSRTVVDDESVLDIRWTSHGSVGGHVQLDLVSTDSTRHSITKRTRNNGAYRWYIPDNVRTLAGAYQVEIRPCVCSGKLLKWSSQVFRMVKSRDASIEV